MLLTLQDALSLHEKGFDITHDADTNEVIVTKDGEKVDVNTILN